MNKKWETSFVEYHWRPSKTKHYRIVESDNKLFAYYTNHENNSQDIIHFQMGDSSGTEKLLEGAKKSCEAHWSIFGE